MDFVNQFTNVNIEAIASFKSLYLHLAWEFQLDWDHRSWYECRTSIKNIWVRRNKAIKVKNKHHETYSCHAIGFPMFAKTNLIMAKLPPRSKLQLIVLVCNENRMILTFSFECCMYNNWCVCFFSLSNLLLSIFFEGNYRSSISIEYKHKQVTWKKRQP